MDKLLGFVKNNGNRSQLKKALEVQLPTSSIYQFLEGRLPHPAHTYTRVAEITEADEKELINKQIGERRTRLGARKDQVTTDVKREIYGRSQLEELYQNVIDWTNDDEIRREFEEKLLQRAYDNLLVLGQEQKSDKRKQVMKLAHGMVLIKHPYLLAWDIELEWADVEAIGDLDVGVLREYISFFPEKGLSAVLKGYLSSDISPFPPSAPQSQQTMPGAPDDSEDEGGGVSLTGLSPLMSAEDRLVLMSDGLMGAKESALAHRLLGEYYAHLEEDESTVETVRNGLVVLGAESAKSGLKMFNLFDSMNNLLATALIRYQSPKNHPEAKTLFEQILKRRPTFTPAMIGIGLILEEEENYTQAISYLSKALKRDPANARVGAELAWCIALDGDLHNGIKELEKYYARIDSGDPKTREVRAEILYRMGKCEWELEPSRDSRKDRKGPYAQFLASIKTNINYAPAYTALGVYYEDYARDKNRARQCFQKAFDLSGSEILAAERLARSYANHSDWDIVEVIAQRVVDSGKARPAPGAKRKGISWPYSALGVVQMNKQEYQQAIVSFLAALRISPDDYHSYIGLGESYHNSGRYNSSLRTFEFAENPEEGLVMKRTGEGWFTKYMLANVNRELGSYDEAVEAYTAVLQDRPKEFGVEIALLQTLVERAWRAIETGFFGQAARSAAQAFDVAGSIVEHMPNVFNLWKAVADACSIFASVQQELPRFPQAKVVSLLRTTLEPKEYELFADADGVGSAALDELSLSHTSNRQHRLSQCLQTAILAQKRAILSCTHDTHAQAVAWYNLGWVEYRAHICLDSAHIGGIDVTKKHKKTIKFLKATVRCFKRAIELEAGNADFWNALGVATTQLNPKVAQHSFVRALHLNERNVKAWTNSGVLYISQGDVELAHKAFTRAQSTDPDYAHAWVGEGLVALLFGDVKEALLHFTHAFEISDSSSSITKREFAAHSFDSLITNHSVASSDVELVRPLFALRQLQSLNGEDDAFDHLFALYNERIGAQAPATAVLTASCEKLEQEYETAESPEVVAHLATAKADLGRIELASHNYESATDNADMTVALLPAEDDESNDSSAERRRKLLLSAHLTIGLAQHYKGDMEAALRAFEAALKESSAAPDVICFLAEVLWARGGTEERSVARDQLFDSLQNHPEHVDTAVLLGIMAVIDHNEETMEAVHEQLEEFRVSEGLNERDAARIERVLEAIVELSPDAPSENPEALALAEIQKTIMLYPWKHTGWARLADVTSDAYPAKMALTTAESRVAPRGHLGAEELAAAFAHTGTVADAQRAIMVAPWTSCTWSSLVEAVAS